MVFILHELNNKTQGINYEENGNVSKSVEIMENHLKKKK